MRIGIIGTRGIPNHYGGFEQFAEKVAVIWVQKGHEVTVYNSHNHPYQESHFKGVEIIHCFDPEQKLGTVGQFVYDLNCILDARKRKYDIFLQLGYTSSSIWSFLMPKTSLIVTNMDGLEWRRSKYSPIVQKFLKRAEKWAIEGSDVLVADSIGIQDYLTKSYNAQSKYIAYGAEVCVDESSNSLMDYVVSKFNYNLVIARLEPENSIEIILDGYVLSGDRRPILIVGNHLTKYGEYLKRKYQSSNGIRFLGGIYDSQVINQLRIYCHLYFHGHTVGGTNPSLLEAMACGSVVCAHRNVFNRSILQGNGIYFENPEEVSEIMSFGISEERRLEIQNGNRQQVALNFGWEKIAIEYLRLFEDAMLKSLHG